jgi:hypothetical protein
MAYLRKSTGKRQGEAASSRNGTHSTKTKQEDKASTHKRNETAKSQRKKTQGHVVDEDELDLGMDLDDDVENEDDTDDDGEAEGDVDDNNGTEDDDDDDDELESGNATGGQTNDDEFVGSMWQSVRDDKQPCFRVLKWVALITETKAELLVLSQFVYWFGEGKNKKLRGRIKRKGYHWVYKTYRQMGRETLLSRDQVVRAIRSLKEAEVLVADDDVDKGHRVYYRLNAIKIQKLVEANPHNVVQEGDDEDQ